MTQQEIFDKVKTHLLTQNAKAEVEMGFCLYRHPKGLMCAAGCLISDEEYSPEMEGNNFPMLFPKFFSEDHPLFPHITLIRNLQKVHDDLNPPAWPEALTNVANSYNLKG